MTEQRMSEIKNFRGLLYEPTYEEEVVILFSLLIPHLRDSFVIDSYSGAFPDCFAKRNGKDVGIEFELQASNFFQHRHHQDKNLSKCNLIVCWKNIPPYRTINKDGREFLRVNEQTEIEMMALSKIVKALEKEKSLKFIISGKRPSMEEANEKRFFEQLQGKTDRARYEWIKELYEWVTKKEEFEVGWGHGKRWFTMRFYVKKWEVDPMDIVGDGMIGIGYQGNSDNSPWELPQETQTILRQMFRHNKLNRQHELPKWPSAALNAQEDFDRLKKALEILAEHSKRTDIIWHQP